MEDMPIRVSSKVSSRSVIRVEKRRKEHKISIVQSLIVSIGINGTQQ